MNDDRHTDDKSDDRRVLIVDSPENLRNLAMKFRSGGMTTVVMDSWKAEQRQIAAEIAEIESAKCVHTGDMRQGKTIPVLTTLAAKFPLLSRRERRAMQRAIGKQADKERAEREK